MNAARLDQSGLLAALRDPDAIPPEAIPATLGELESVRAALWARLIHPETSETPSRPEETPSDGLLTAGDVARRLGVHRRWVYRHAEQLGAVRLSEARVRFPVAGVERFLSRRKGRTK